MITLVTGGAGVLGSRLTRGLVERGIQVRVLTLPGDPFVSRLDGLDCEIAYGDATDPKSLEGVMDGVDTVYHLAAILLSNDEDRFERINVGGTRTILEASAAAGVRHFILVSSISVTYPYSTAYSRSKRECEEMVRSRTDMAWTIVRPTLIYDGEGGEEFGLFKKHVLRFDPIPFVGSGAARKNPVWVEDIMRGMVAIPGNPKSHGKVYALSGSEEITLRRMAEVILRAEGIRKAIVPVPAIAWRTAAHVLARVMKRPPFTWQGVAGLSQDACPDWSNARQDLDYHPIGFSEGYPKALRRLAEEKARPSGADRKERVRAAV